MAESVISNGVTISSIVLNSTGKQYFNDLNPLNAKVKLCNGIYSLQVSLVTKAQLPSSEINLAIADIPPHTGISGVVIGTSDSGIVGGAYLSYNGSLYIHPLSVQASGKELRVTCTGFYD